MTNYIYYRTDEIAMAEESEAELMEKIKKMSPEELLEFQKSRCIFCHIISGKVQSKKIYDDAKVTAILDINPANPGHVLLMPKEHYSIMPQVPEDILNHSAMVIKRISQIALQSLGVKGVNILIQNGIAAGQKAQHFMIHIIPRKQGDGLNLVMDKKTISDTDYETVKSRLKKKVYEIFGKPEPSPIKEAEIKESPPSFTAQQTPSMQLPSMPSQEDQVDLEPSVPLLQEEETSENIGTEVPVQEEGIHAIPEKYWTSSKAKRYHTPKCPFAQNIPKDKLIILTEEQAISSGRKACTCVSGKKIPTTMSDQNITETLDVTNEVVEELNDEINTISKELDIERQSVVKDGQSKTNQSNMTDLDRIARLLGGKR